MLSASFFSVSARAALASPVFMPAIETPLTVTFSAKVTEPDVMYQMPAPIPPMSSSTASAIATTLGALDFFFLPLAAWREETLAAGL